ncbi:hypothetical protein [Rhodanobacter sp. DHB23]|uniref:hypothetical protein n=1 Tax=Rhodanobacter sp. DHB23 TaxID=2775923 RepID=UPI0017873D81|nr:hypothetical protein [Rhodanobacter sp. DHB23]MBD8871833.1 hypothetical protein [Rhodanobacter sp. DHB23]
MKNVIGIAALSCVLSCSAPARAGASAPAPVTYQVPASWKRMSDDGTPAQNQGAMFEVTTRDSSEDHPLVVIRSYKQPSGLSMDNIDLEQVAKKITPGGVPISCADDGTNWKTCVFLGHVDDKKIVVLYRIGVKDGYVAEEAFLFPLAAAKSDELALLTVYGQEAQQGRTTGVYAALHSTYKTISLFNEFTKTLGINGPAPFNAKAIMAKLPEEAHPTVYRWKGDPAGSSSAGG